MKRGLEYRSVDSDPEHCGEFMLADEVEGFKNLREECKGLVEFNAR